MSQEKQRRHSAMRNLFQGNPDAALLHQILRESSSPASLSNHHQGSAASSSLATTAAAAAAAAADHSMLLASSLNNSSLQGVPSSRNDLNNNATSIESLLAQHHAQQQQQQQQQMGAPDSLFGQTMIASILNSSRSGVLSQDPAVIIETLPKEKEPLVEAVSSRPAHTPSCSTTPTSNMGMTVTNKNNNKRKATNSPSDCSDSVSAEETRIRKEKVEEAFKSKPQPGKKRDDLNEGERQELAKARNREHAKQARSVVV
jgi:hypothetical protein